MFDAEVLNSEKGVKKGVTDLLDEHRLPTFF